MRGTRSKKNEDPITLPVTPTPTTNPGKPKRFGFTILKDIALLKAALQHNPFQLGTNKWMDVARDLVNTFQDFVSERTARERVLHLKKRYEKQQLTFKTGTEEERTERGKLIEEVIALITESEATINVEYSASEEMNFSTSEEPATVVTNKKQQRNEKLEADKEREKAASETVPEPNQKRRKLRVLPEDELIKIKMQHDMKLEAEKLRIEEEKTKRDQEMEEKRLDIELKKLELEREKENRLVEDNKRKDEIARMQIEFQQQFINVLVKITEKQ